MVAWNILFFPIPNSCHFPTPSVHCRSFWTAKLSPSSVDSIDRDLSSFRRCYCVGRKRSVWLSWYEKKTIGEMFIPFDSRDMYGFRERFMAWIQKKKKVRGNFFCSRRVRGTFFYLTCFSESRSSGDFSHPSRNLLAMFLASYNRAKPKLRNRKRLLGLDLVFLATLIYAAIDLALILERRNAYKESWRGISAQNCPLKKI